ncbi:MAG TPA: hypothetical protein VGD43_20455, partial [Micromonospora sp.]
MKVRLHEDLSTFAALMRPVAEADPVRHTLLATLVTSRTRPGAPDDVLLALTVHDDDGALL